MKEELALKLSLNYPEFEETLVNEIIENSSYKVFEADEILLKSGEQIKNTMLILNGRVKIYREDEEGKEYFIYFLEPGSACALSIMCGFRNEKSQIMAKTEVQTEAILLPFFLIENLMRKYNSWNRFVVETYRNRFEELLQTVDQIAFKSLDQRLMDYLTKQTEVHNSYFLPITHSQIAEDLNSSREVISRLLKKLENKNIVRLSRNQIEVIKK